MTRNTKIALLALLLTTFAACKKHNSTPGNVGGSPNPDVYVLGKTGDSLVYWKNGAATLLANGNPVTTISGMAVSGNNVYVSGSVVGNSVNASTAEYWQNGSPAILPDTTGSAYANAIYVSGTDIYTAGTIYYPLDTKVPYTTHTAPYPTTGNVAVWWKNGIPTPLPSSYFVGDYIGNGSRVYDGYVSGIFVNGSDVYVAGGSHQYLASDTSTWQFSLYWKNGQAFNLSRGLADSNADGSFNYPTTTGICVSGNDVYVCGIQTTSYPGLSIQAVYWKNGVATNLTPGSYKAVANGIFVSGSDVYVAGYVVTGNGTLARAVYWKNGLINYLSSSPSLASGICVIGNDIYVAGTENVNGADYATWWKNGAPTHLGTGGDAIAISVD